MLSKGLSLKLSKDIQPFTEKRRAIELADINIEAEYDVKKDTVKRFVEFQHFAYVRRIVSNKAVSKYKDASLRNAIYSAANSICHGYSSLGLIGKILQDQDLVDVISTSTGEFSLLGKIKTKDYSKRFESQDGKTINLEEMFDGAKDLPVYWAAAPYYIITRPVLFVSDTPDKKKADEVIAKWEERNTTYDFAPAWSTEFFVRKVQEHIQRNYSRDPHVRITKEEYMQKIANPPPSKF
jgi:hypothetical protein